VTAKPGSRLPVAETAEDILGCDDGAGTEINAALRRGYQAGFDMATWMQHTRDETTNVIQALLPRLKAQRNAATTAKKKRDKVRKAEAEVSRLRSANRYLTEAAAVRKYLHSVDPRLEGDDLKRAQESLLRRLRRSRQRKTGR
jgi:hypothetical protein